MSNISFTDIYYPDMTDPRYKMLCTLHMQIASMLNYAKQYQKRESQFAWENMHDEYNMLIGMVSAFSIMGMLSHDDILRIPYITYRVALKIACDL